MHSFAPPRPPMQPQITTVTELSLAPESQFCKREYRKENCICVLEVSALRSRIRSHLGNSDLWQNPDALADGYRSRREGRAERHCFRKTSANRCFRNGQTMVQVTHHWVPSHKAATSLWKQKPSLLGAPENGTEKGDIFMSYLYVKWNSFGVVSRQ